MSNNWIILRERERESKKWTLINICAVNNLCKTIDTNSKINI